MAATKCRLKVDSLSGEGGDDIQLYAAQFDVTMELALNYIAQQDQVKDPKAHK